MDHLLFVERLNDMYPTFDSLNSHIVEALKQKEHISGDYSRLPDQHLSAGVLISLVIPKSVIDENLPPISHTYILYEKRAETMKNHPGDIAFPGGTLEDVDKDPKDAAFREAKEEVGINPDDLEFISYMDEFISSSKILVHPVIAWLIEEEDRSGFVTTLAEKYYPRTSESTATIVIPLTHLLNPDFYHSQMYTRNGKHVGWVRYFDTTGFRDDDHIWGLTASMTRRFIDTIFPNNDLPEEIFDN